VDGTRTPRTALDLKFKQNTPTAESRTRWFNQVLEVIKKTGKSWQEMEKEKLQEGNRDWRLFVH
jgi:prophage antirepressor-like protein